MTHPYYLGCPMWSNKSWTGRFFTRKAKPAEFLKQYSSVLTTVEGNTTFYAVPAAATVLKWRASAAPGFRFCFKFPRVISHDKALRDAQTETEAFFQALAPLHGQLGPFFLQLPPHFDNFTTLRRYLESLPTQFDYAVELRSPRFFRQDALERDLEQMLAALEMDRVVFDTRRLMSLETGDPELKDAQRRKPKTPVRTQALGRYPFLRYVGYPEVERDVEAVRVWTGVVAGWIREGRTPFVFMHQAPDDERAPELCRLFHETLRKELPELPDMPPWPIEKEGPEQEQLSLF
ncbi:MAG: DUF72 domain-containing protein [Acidobacteriota bacterium]|nr:DUF72 domain-containing protein [Acidobacteriota bacterium]